MLNRRPAALSSKNSFQIDAAERAQLWPYMSARCGTGCFFDVDLSFIHSLSLLRFFNSTIFMKVLLDDQDTKELATVVTP
jgi:hypothetical protein